MFFHSLINIRKEVATLPSFLKYILPLHFSNCTKPLSYFKCTPNFAYLQDKVSILTALLPTSIIIFSSSVKAWPV